jgi:hypothetical protein
MGLGTQTEAGFQPDSGMARASTKAFAFDTPPNRSLKECGYEHFVADARNQLPLIGAGGAKIVQEGVRRLGARASPRQPSARS